MQTRQPDTKAAIWDMDGVMVDSAELHFKAWQRLMHELGRSLSYDEFVLTFGRKNADILRELLSPDLTPEQLEELSDRKERYFREQARAGLRAFPGVKELVQKLHRAGYRQAVASSAPPENIDLILSMLKLKPCFSAVVSADDIDRGKPDPQVFLLAAQRLQVPPACALVIEDSVAGVQAAKAAGMSVIAVTNTRTREELREADIVVDSLGEVSVELVDLLISNQ